MGSFLKESERQRAKLETSCFFHSFQKGYHHLLPHHRFSHHCQTWHGDCLRHEITGCVNYIDVDLHSRSHKS